MKKLKNWENVYIAVNPTQRAAGTDASDDRARFARELPPDRNIPQAPLITRAHLKFAIAAKQ